MTTITAIVMILVLLIAPMGNGPDVAEINYFQYAECENVFYWQTDTEINIWGFRLEHVAVSADGRWVDADRRNGAGGCRQQRDVNGRMVIVWQTT
ncbi:MAG: hypothetical protein IPK78_18295 [Rhodospirillales bacterium]|nr:hypothetical protein [Rhodospirillales bacterium]